jgi:hypothetical protein
MMAGPGMTGPAATGPQGSAPALVSVAPRGGSTGVAISEPIALHFGAPMAAGMEQYVDLHVGHVGGPLVPVACGFSSDRTTLTCLPNGPLAPRTAYVLHVGGGMMTAAGQPIDYGTHGPGMGGLWLAGGMMGPAHAGHGWGMMGPGWRHSNGSYGMEFSFTTA